MTDDDKKEVKQTYEKNWKGLNNEEVDQETLRILQEAMSKSWQELDYLMHKKKDLLAKIRGEIYLRRQEYAGVAQELQERGFELVTRDSEEHGLAVEEMRLYHPEHQIVVTTDYSLKEMTGIAMVCRLPEIDEYFEDGGYTWEEIEVLAAATHKDRVKLADQVLTDTVRVLEEIENGEE